MHNFKLAAKGTSGYRRAAMHEQISGNKVAETFFFRSVQAFFNAEYHLKVNGKIFTL